MTKITTRIFKSVRGLWTGETRVPLGWNHDGNPAILRVSTSKRDGGKVETYASVMHVDGGFETMAIFEDFHTQCRAIDGRATEKAVTNEHKYWLGHITEGYNLVALARAHQVRKGKIDGAE